MDLPKPSPMSHGCDQHIWPKHQSPISVANIGVNVTSKQHKLLKSHIICQIRYVIGDNYVGANVMLVIL